MANQAGKDDSQPNIETFLILIEPTHQHPNGQKYVRTTIKYDITAIQYQVIDNNIIPNALAPRPMFDSLEGIQFGEDLNQQEERLVTSFPAVEPLNVIGESKRPDVNVRLITIPNDGSYIKVTDDIRGNGKAYKIVNIRESITQEDGFVAGGRKSKRKTRKRRRKSRKKKRTRRRKRKTKSLFKKKRTKKRGYGGKSLKRRK